MKTVLIGIARMGSTRFPGKVLAPLGGRPMLQWIVEAGRQAPGVHEVWIATSALEQDDVIEEWCKENAVKCFRGSETDVLSRFYGAALAAKADVAVRVTCDCPFIDPRVIGEVVALREATMADYASNIDPPTWPDGLDCEAIQVSALGEADFYANRPSDRNTVTQYIQRNRYKYDVVNLTCPIPGMHKERWVLDTQDDYKLCQAIAENSEGFGFLNILEYLNKNPDVRKLNAHHVRNERFWDELVAEEPVERSHARSKFLAADTQAIIPLATQTFSKSHLQYPEESPLFLTHGSAGLVYDVDGNDYVDLVGGLLPVILGHRDPDVDYAIRRQLDHGTSLSLASPLEARLANKLIKHIPCAEMVRFGKNGTDVTSAAVRLARYVTGREKVLSSGYHGWMDWSIAHDPVRNMGVPQAYRDLTTPLRHGDIQTANHELFKKEYACVIVEPETDREFLSRLRNICNATGTLLIFDEIITGFRFGLGGAGKLFGVKPDLATFGKAMANGMPISALVGLKEHMRHMEKLCFSGTFFGETLSLAAALATIEKIERESVIQSLHALNRSASTIVGLLADQHQCYCLRVSGNELSRITFVDVGMHKKEDLKTLFMQEMIRNGVLIIASHNFMYAHNEADMRRLFNAYDKTFEVLSQAIKDGGVKQRIVGRSIEASANVRSA